MDWFSMGQVTTLYVALTRSDSLRTTTPMRMAKHFRLRAADKLDWDSDIKNGQMALVVRVLRRSSGRHGSGRLSKQALRS